MIAALALVASVSLADLSWLQGCWSDGAYEECWNAPSGGSMHAVGRHVKDGKTVELEMIELRETGAGLVYTALILENGLAVKQNGVPFTLAKSEKDTWAFENASHDFPQRIVYVKKKKAIDVRIESLDGKKKIEFKLEKRCAA